MNSFFCDHHHHHHHHHLLLPLLLLLYLPVFGRAGPCLQKTLIHEPKYFYYGDKFLDVRLLTSDRLTHQLISSVVQIYIQEVIGYSNVSLKKLEFPSKAFDHDTLFSQVSSCQDFSCQNLDDHTVTPAPIPEAMINLEMWLPLNYQVYDWKVEDIGRLGPGGRFGWFIPESFANNSSPIKDHWRAFTKIDVAQLFSISNTELITSHLKNNQSQYFCEESYCQNTGMFTPQLCDSRNLSSCALLLTDFPIESSYFYSSKILIQQIVTYKLFVQVAFLGSHLMRVLMELTNSPDVKSGLKSFLVFHYTPSPISTLLPFTTVKFEPCTEKNNGGFTELNSENDEMSSSNIANCLYDYNRFAKIIWPPLKEGAPSLYEALRKIEFSTKDYKVLLEFYHNVLKTKNSHESDSHIIEKVACIWLNSISESGKRNYEKWTPSNRVKKVLRIGGIFPMRGNKYTAPELLPVATLAQDDVNADSSILPNYDIQLNVFDGQCKADIVMKRFIEIITNKDYKFFVGILGPACSDTVEPIAGVSKHFTTVVITYSAEGSISSRGNAREHYPYFFRTIAENKQYKYVYLEMFKKFGWSKIASLTQNGHKYSDYISHLQDVLHGHNINFIMNRKFQRESSDMSLYLKDLKDRGARIIIGEFFETAARIIMCEAFHQKMTQNEGYVWFLPAWFQYNWFDIDSLRRQRQGNSSQDEFLPNCTTANMYQALNGHLSLMHAQYANDEEIMQTGATVKSWKEIVKKKLNQHHFDGNHPNKYSGYVYDAVWVYAKALDKLIKENKSYIQDIHSDRSITEFVKIINNIDFKGVTGRINFINGPSRLSNIKIKQWYENGSHEIGIYEPDYESILGEGKLIEWKDSMLRWQTPSGGLPKDHSKECSILSSFATSLNVECEQSISIAFILGFGSLLTLLFLLFLLLKRRYEVKMRQTEERMRALGLLTPTSVLTLDGWEIHRDRVVLNRKLGEGAFGTVYGGEAFFDEKGWVAVAVKTLKTGSSVEEKLDFLSEAEMMKRFDHRNIIKLLGVCTRNEPIYTVMEFMLYGDLKTYLLARRHLVNERNREELDEVSNRRLTSMALDVAKGLSYLADLKYVHRDVACRNCLVNSSRVVKLADFGMTRAMYENDYYRFSRKGMLPVRWMAPESLSDGLFTPLSDIWSYGVLLYEMTTFGSFPFQGLSNNQVLEHVKVGNTLTIPSGIKPQLETLLKSCWAKSSTKRPTASEIAELLSNSPRLISPCIDVPLASVVVERTGSLELIPSVRKPSGTVSSTNKHFTSRRLGNPLKNDEYSSMIDSSQRDPIEPLLLDSKRHGPAYVPSGYILLDHSIDEKYSFDVKDQLKSPF